jgi:Mrp family chromosome partitioning ATPase/uncharacterized protein involved in exopolysaccharide biosynthesis
MDIIFIFKLLYRKIWLLLFVPLLAGLTTFFISKNSTKLYESSGQLATGFTTNEEINISDDHANIRDAGTKFSNLMEKMNSPQVLNLVSFSLIIHDLKTSQPFRLPRDSKGDPISLPQEKRDAALRVFEQKYEKFELLSSFNQSEKDLLRLIRSCGYNIEIIKKNLAIRRVNFTDFIAIEFQSENPELSAFVVNTLMSEIIRYEKSLRSDRSSESLEFFASLVEKKKKELDDKTLALNTYKQENNVVDYKLENENRLSQITYYELKRDEEFKNVQAMKLSLASLEDKIGGLGQEGVRNQKNEKIIELKKKINDLNQIYVEGNSKDQKLFATIENLRERLQIEMANSNPVSNNAISTQDANKLRTDRDDVKLRLKIASANLESINSTLWSIKGNVSGNAYKESNISNLERDVDRASEEYLQAVDKFNMEKSKSLISNISLKPILTGQPAGDPESSKTLIKTILAFFVSLVLCIVAVVLVEFLDFSIKTPLHFQRMTKLELSGVLNVMRNANELKLNEIFAEESARPENKKFKNRIRKVRFEIEKAASQIILVTSTQEKAGKSFLIVCLAYSLSLIHKKILIVDTNFKNNTLSRMLLPQKMSEQKLLKRAETIKSLGPVPDTVDAEKDNSIISKTALKNIYIIGSKKSQESPSEILSGRAFTDLLTDLRKSYDYIFLEGASLNDYSDAKELIAFADMVLPVFSAETTITDADRQSIKFLRSLNGRLIGSVLNKVSEKNLKF